MKGTGNLVGAGRPPGLPETVKTEPEAADTLSQEAARPLNAAWLGGLPLAEEVKKEEMEEEEKGEGEGVTSWLVPDCKEQHTSTEELQGGCK